jgi:hypothetical protein
MRGAWTPAEALHSPSMLRKGEKHPDPGKLPTSPPTHAFPWVGYNQEQLLRGN